jgi:hypothetical protein
MKNETEIKYLIFRSTQLYIAHLRAKGANEKRDIYNQMKGLQVAIDYLQEPKVSKAA